MKFGRSSSSRGVGGQARLEKLRTESSFNFGLPGVSDQGGQKQMVKQLQAKRDAFAEKLLQQDCGAEPLDKKAMDTSNTASPGTRMVAVLDVV